MNAADIDRVESELSVRLPQRFREILQDYPFDEDSFGYTCMLYHEVDGLIEDNKGLGFHFMLHHRKGRWTPTKAHLLIGGDGGEEQYYLDLDAPTHPVLKFDLETGVLEEYVSDIDAYISKVYEIDREIAEDERRVEEKRKNAKWWEFWKKI